MTLYQVRYGGTLTTGELWNFNIWFSSSQALSAMLDDAETWITTAWGATSADGIQSATPTTVTATSVHVGTITQATGIQTTATASTIALAGGVSTAGSVPCPPDTAATVTLRTALTGRSYRGRFYLPQPSSLLLTTAGKWDSTKLGVVRDGIADAYAAVSATSTPVLYRRTEHAIENITQFDMTDLPACQSRRMNKTVPVRIVGTIT